MLETDVIDVAKLRRLCFNGNVSIVCFVGGSFDINFFFDTNCRHSRLQQFSWHLLENSVGLSGAKAR